MERDLVLILVALAGMSVLLMIRVCGERERVALNTPQRFVKLIGPGLFLRIPMQLSPCEYTRVRIGDTGRIYRQWVGQDRWSEYARSGSR